MKLATTILLFLFISYGFSQSIFIKDFGNSKQPQRYYGIDNGIQLNSNLFGLVNSVSGQSNNTFMNFYDSTGNLLSNGIYAPRSWSGQSFPTYFKLKGNRILMTGIGDDSTGSWTHYTEVYDSLGNNLWKSNTYGLSTCSSVKNNHLLGFTNSNKPTLVKFNDPGLVEWEITTDTLLGGLMKDTLLVSRNCGWIKDNYWIVLQSYQSDSSLLVIVDSSQNIISRNLFFSNHYLKAKSTGNEFILFETLLNNNVALGYKIQVFDHNFNFLQVLSTSSHESSINQAIITNGYIYLLVHHTENTYKNSRVYSEVQKLDFRGNVMQRNFYRFWLNRWGQTNAIIGQSTDFRSLEVCSDEGYLLTGYIADGYDRRTIAIKLDSNGLGKDTLRVPVELLPLGYMDSTFSLIDTNQTGIENKTKVGNEILQTFPNPANHEVMIKANSAIKSVKLYNRVGEMIIQKFLKSKETSLSTTELYSGIYLVEINYSNGMIERRKIIVQH